MTTYGLIGLRRVIVPSPAQDDGNVNPAASTCCHAEGIPNLHPTDEVTSKCCQYPILPPSFHYDGWPVGHKGLYLGVCALFSKERKNSSSSKSPYVVSSIQAVCFSTFGPSWSRCEFGVSRGINSQQSGWLWRSTLSDADSSIEGGSALNDRPNTYAISVWAQEM